MRPDDEPIKSRSPLRTDGVVTSSTMCTVKPRCIKRMAKARILQASASLAGDEDALGGQHCPLQSVDFGGVHRMQSAREISEHGVDQFRR